MADTTTPPEDDPSVDVVLDTHVDTTATERPASVTPEWILVKEAAHRTGKSPRQIKRLVAAGKVSAQSSDPSKSNAPTLVRWTDVARHYGEDAAATGPGMLVLADQWQQITDRIATAEAAAERERIRSEHLAERLAEARDRERELELVKDRILTRRQRRWLARIMRGEVEG